MANKKHLQILKKGVETWNKWREKHLEAATDYESQFIDLTKARLQGANLSGYNLSYVDLLNADLRNASLTNVNLYGSQLTGADMRGVDLTNACLILAEFSSAKGDNPTKLADAILKDVQITTEEDDDPEMAHVLDLATADGLEHASFGNTSFLTDYLSSAFAYCHQNELVVSHTWPTFFKSALKHIRALQKLYTHEEPPIDLVKTVKLITKELIAYLKKHPYALYGIRPRKFEELIAEILASYGWEVQLTPPLKDGGYDIFAISKDTEAKIKTSWIIECKKYAPENKVGVDIVRALYGIKSNLKVANALLATTSYFTKGAREFKASRYDIELKDYQSILEWINEYRPNPKGKLYIKDNKLIVPNE